MMRRELNGAALALLAGSVALFCAGLIFAVSNWDEAVTDRAYVEAARRAVEAERSGTLAAEEGRMRMWVPQDSAVPAPGFRLREEQLSRSNGPLKGAR